MGFIKTPFLIALLVYFSFSSIHACDIDGKTGFMPENDMWVGPHDKSNNGMTEEKFNTIVDRIIEKYKGIVLEERGKVLVAKKHWDDGMVNASAMQIGRVYQVNMYGGLARHPLINEDGFALVVCHELGHHLGGAPKKTTRRSMWASNEGQADYFSAMKCFRRVFGEDDNISIVKNMEVEPFITKKCNESFNNAHDIALCQRTSVGAMSVSSLVGGGVKVNASTPDKGVVSSTYDGHPKGQCRMDTYFAGALCDKKFYDDVDFANPEVGVCTRENGYSAGVRPLCWYRVPRT